jgi:hypothetical protein
VLKRLQHRETFKIACLFAGILCLLALLPLPMLSFYSVLRWTACAVALWAAVVAYCQGRSLLLILFAAIAALFNPFLLVFLRPLFWRSALLLAAAAFFAASSCLRADSLAARFAPVPDSPNEN